MSHLRFHRLGPPALLAAALGCGGVSDRAEKKADQDSHVVAHEAKRVWESLRGYRFEKKAVFLEKAGAAVQVVERSVADFRSNAKHAFGEDPSWESIDADLRARHEAVLESLAKVGEATPETWEDLKGRFFVALTDLRKAMDSAIAKLS